MTRWVVGLAALLLVAAMGQGQMASGAQVYSFVDYGGEDYLATVNSATGALSILGPTGIGRSVALDFSPYTGMLYGASQGELRAFHPLSGAGTVLASITPEFFQGLAFSPGGRLLGGNMNNDALWEIDPATGATTNIGGFGVDMGTMGMDFAQDGTLYLIEGTNTHSLYTVDPGTGAATLVGDLGVLPQGGVDLAIAADGTIYASAATSRGAELFTVDAATGAATHVAMMVPPYGSPTPAALGAWAPIVPEPSTLAIWSLLAMLGITIGWRRRTRTAAYELRVTCRGLRHSRRE